MLSDRELADFTSAGREGLPHSLANQRKAVLAVRALAYEYRVLKRKYLTELASSRAADGIIAELQERSRSTCLTFIT